MRSWHAMRPADRRRRRLHAALDLSRRPLRAGLLCLAVSGFGVAVAEEAPGGAQGVAPSCGDAELNLIFQAKPLAENQHQSRVLNDGATRRLDVRVERGATGRATAAVGIVSRLTSVRGVQGWAIQTRFSGDVTIVDATVEGTAAAMPPDGLVNGGFAQVRIPTLRNEPGFYSAAVLSFADPVTLLPSGTATVLRFTVAARRAQGADPISGLIEWVDGCVGCASPFIMSATVNGGTRRFCSRPTLELRFVDASAPQTAWFLRCDPTGDGRVDIVDAIHIANHLFLERPAAPCLDSEDCNGDRRVNLTDVVYAVNFLFDEGPRPPAPFPVCGAADGTVAAASCPPGSAGASCR